jgi:hypothetical protein
VASRQEQWMIIGYNKNPETYSCWSQFLLLLRKRRLTSPFNFSFPMDQKTIVLYLHMKEMELGYVKRNLMGCRADSLSELLIRIQVSLRAKPGKTLIEVFLEWIKRLQ